jgi:hypothetical protein
MNSHTNYINADTAPGPFTLKDVDNIPTGVLFAKNPSLTARVFGLRAVLPEVWHARLGHLGLDNMGLLISKDMVRGFRLTKSQIEDTKKNPDRFCEPCVLANAKRAPSPTSLNPATTRILEHLHTNLAGPYATTSYNDKSYVLTVLDDYTKLSSIKCLKHKDDVAAALIHICNSLENQCRDMDGSSLIKAVRSDNGTEYINSEVKAYFSSKGIDQQTTAPYNPQSNGSVECLDRVLWQKSTAMLLAANLSEEFWSLAVEAANYVRNRSPHKATPGNQPPYALFRRCKPNISHLRIFGCACYPVLDLTSRSKCKLNIIKGVFMGYEPLPMAYRVYFPDTGKLRVYRDVIFNEMPLLANLKRRHTLLLEELEEWPEEAAHEHPTPEAPAPAHTPSASFPD